MNDPYPHDVSLPVSLEEWERTVLRPLMDALEKEMFSAMVRESEGA